MGNDEKENREIDPDTLDAFEQFTLWTLVFGLLIAVTLYIFGGEL